MNKIKRNAILIEIGIIICNLIVLLWYLKNPFPMQHTVKAQIIAPFLLLAGISIGFLIFYLIFKIGSIYLEEKNFITILSVGIMYLSMMLVTKVVIELNYYFAENDNRFLSIEIIDKKIMHLPERHYLITELNNWEQLVYVNETMFRNIEIGEKIELQICSGYFGFDVMKNIRKK